MCKEIDVGVEQELIGYVVAFTSSTGDYKKLFATVSYTDPRDNKPLDCVWITGDIVVKQCETQIKETLELASAPVNMNDSFAKAIHKYVLDELFSQLKQKQIGEMITLEVLHVPPHSFVYYDTTTQEQKSELISFEINNYQEENWYLQRTTESLHLANQITIGMYENYLLEYVNPKNPHRPVWINEYIPDNVALNYSVSLLRKSYDTIFRYIMFNYSQGDVGYSITKEDIDSVLSDLNHAEIKNLWSILPRSYLYRIIDSCGINLDEAIEKSIVSTGLGSKDVVIKYVSNYYKEAYQKDKKTADTLLHAGLIDREDKEKNPVYLFEYRSLNEQISVLNDLTITCAEYLGTL